MAWRHQRRGRRLKALGGNKYPKAHLYIPTVPRFQPDPINEAGAREKLNSLIEGLAPEGVDEATGHPLDNLINAMADQWVADVRAQHARYVATLTPMMELAEATTSQTDVVVMHDRSILSHQVLGLESALLRMVGHDPKDHRDPSGRRRRWFRFAGFRRLYGARRYASYPEGGDHVPSA
ncbi:MAG TPA: hypothetical protein VN969_07080 [Streptosporangiaceae bacterium]|nr:hypothetical protein [Streptosporangiaceae bacterium]